MKTVKQWAQELPEDVREKFIANVASVQKGKRLKWKFKSLSDAIASSFIWDASPEKDNFWRNINNKLKSENR